MGGQTHGKFSAITRGSGRYEGAHPEPKGPEKHGIANSGKEGAGTARGKLS